MVHDSHTVSPMPLQSNPDVQDARREPYSAPRLEALGELRTMTLGPSPGLGESTGGNQNFNPRV